MNIRPLLFFLFLLFLAGIFWITTPAEKTELQSDLTPPAADLVEQKKPIPKTKTTKRDRIQKQDSRLTPLPTWVNELSKNLDGSLSAEKQQEVEQRASRFSTTDLSLLKEWILSTSEPINKRIFATYLLSLSGRSAISTLGQILEKEPEFEGPHPTHSTNEVRSTQEKSLKIMAIDALADTAKTDPEARSQLKKATETLRNPTVLKYARKKLQELK